MTRRIDDANGPQDEGAVVWQLNHAAFSRLLREHKGITISPKELAKWRPCRRVRGVIHGLEPLGKVEALCTDGVIAWFLREDGQLLVGHVATYEWEDGKYGAPPQPYSVSKKGSTSDPKGSQEERTSEGRRPSKESAVKSAKTKKMSSLQLAMQLLQYKKEENK